MAAEIAEKLGVQSELVPGAIGVFDVVADGALIFSKDREGRFPRVDEIIRLLRRTG